MESQAGLADVLSEFARTILTDFPIQGILDHLVTRIVGVLPVTSAGVTMISPGSLPRFIAASDAAAFRYETLQSEVGSAPCSLAVNEGVAVAVPDLAVDDRFPLFSERARRLGLAATFTFPLRHGEACLGALDLYRETTGELDDDTMIVAQTLADVAAAYLLNAQAREDLRVAAHTYRAKSLEDPLTGLPNRTVLQQRLDEAAARSQHLHDILAVLFVDVDKFKQINELHGHLAGDELLVAVAQRLRQAIRPDDIVARLAGDEFVVVCEQLTEPEQADRVAHRIVAALAAPFTLSTVGLAVSVTVSVGIAWSDDAQLTPAQLLADADQAMYEAKRAGGSRHERFSLRGAAVRSRSMLHSDLRDAVHAGQLRNEYQPIVRTSDQTVIGLESLLRWDHPVHGLLTPDLTISLAEQSGLIVDIGRWILEQACTDRHDLLAAAPGRELELCVNVSPVELMSPGFATSVDDILRRTRTPSRFVTLEVTESVYIDDAEHAMVVLQSLKDLGVSIALDDFGTGYSSLMYLQRFPVDTIKLDRDFIARLGRNDITTIIVRTVIDLAHELGTRVVAEGVETADQYTRLIELGCDSCQGYLFARPLRKQQLTDHLAAQRIEPTGSRDEQWIASTPT